MPNILQQRKSYLYGAKTRCVWVMGYVNVRRYYALYLKYVHCICSAKVYGVRSTENLNAGAVGSWQFVVHTLYFGGKRVHSPSWNDVSIHTTYYIPNTC